MRAPLSWLKDFSPIACDPGDPAAVAALRETLDSLGLVVESVEHIGAGLEKIVLAQVREIRAITGADRIRQVLVDAGDGEEVEIVCGATNFSLGDVVPLAPVGAELPNGMVIARRQMRGATSNGMLCSGRELGLDDDAAGLLILAPAPADGEALPDGVELGAPLTAYLGIEPDVVFDLEIEPNRPDCLSIVGVARDLAAALGLPFNIPTPQPVESDPPVAELASAVTLEPEGCPRLVARAASRVALVPSPPRIARRLSLAGMRPINSVVDASNYVMLELGQPTHPYDLSALGGSGITVRRARPGEYLVTLDGGRHDLVGGGDDADLVITDANDAVVGLAGVMGGASSEISEQTTTVLLEVADFTSRPIGVSAQRHGLRTEASGRFWRGIDPDGLERAADRFCELVAESQLAAGLEPPSVARGRLSSGPGRPLRQEVRLRGARLGALLGTDLGLERAAALLATTGFEARREGDALWVTPPSWRPDVTLEVDLVEEVARLHGYREITPTERRSPHVGRLSESQRARRELRRALTGVGASEAWTSSLVEEPLLGSFGASSPLLEVRNPVVTGEKALRSHLVPGLLAALGRNESHRDGAIRLFEIGKVFFSSDGAPTEREHLAVVLAQAGDGAPSAVQLWRRLVDQSRVDASAIALDPLSREVEAPQLAAGLHPARSAVLRDSGGVIAAIGEVDPAVLARFSLEERPVGVVVVDLERFDGLARRSAIVRPVSRFPSADVDLAFVLDERLAAGTLEAALAGAVPDSLESIALLDVYRGPGLPPGTRSLAYRLRFSSLEATLTDAEIAELRRVCIDAAAATGAALRG